jgi:hypothetical protein
MAGVSLLLAACGNQDSPVTSAAAASSYQPHANLAQMMRAIPFPSSNIIFDTQSEDPAAPREPADTSGGATAAYRNVYGGWQEVENSALALAETANLMLIPGRMCENGRPVPVDNEDFRRFNEGLVAAGKAAYEAARSRNLDAMVDVSGTVSEACANCHDVYRDKDDPKDRCVS